jgi:hypothetical protein
MIERNSTGLPGRMRFLALCIAFIWVTHTVALFAHEYAHTFTAWLLGCKSNPLALHYGGFHLANLLFLGQVDENVDYSAIIAQGRGHAAALIAFAGAGLGNGLLYLLSRLLLDREATRRRPNMFLFLFWFCLMNIGNFYDYVPVRTFASHGDMARITQGLRISPWLLLIVAGYPTAWAVWHFFARILPEAFPFVAPDARGLQAFLVAVSAFLMFGFFGASGLFGYGDVSQVLSGISLLAVPGVAATCWPSGASPAG